MKNLPQWHSCSLVIELRGYRAPLVNYKFSVADDCRLISASPCIGWPARWEGLIRVVSFFSMMNLFNSAMLDAALRICMSEYALLKWLVQAALNAIRRGVLRVNLRGIPCCWLCVYQKFEAMFQVLLIIMCSACIFYRGVWGEEGILRLSLIIGYLWYM